MVTAKQSSSPTSSLPEGTVTFLFTDIEGSTNLLQQLGDKYISLLDDHHRILREIFTKWKGREVDTEGDAFFVSFSKATEAVAAVVEAQRTLTEHSWPEGLTVRVRMGLHTGEPWTGSAGYVGMDVHRAARIAHVGYGGQVLLSETTAALLRGNLPEGVTLRDLGQHRLKDMQFPEHIRQLVVDGLPSEFPPLKSLEVVEAIDETELEPLPLPDFLNDEKWQPTAAPVFVGRDSEMAFIAEFLDILFQEHVEDTRGNVLFVVGDAGSGKTALMDAFSRQALTKYPDLLVAQGFCNAFTGFGDPYLPFRSVMGMLTGDLESRIAANTVSREQVENLWQSIPTTVSALAMTGADLIDVMVPGTSLISRIKTSVPSNGQLLQQLSRAEKQKKAGSGELRQSKLFDQYVSVLRVLSTEHPILIILDDLQWADSGSINLLFHLARSLTGCRVLMIGAYRPEEVALGRDDKHHPLKPVLDELKCEFGQIWINLNESKGEAFVRDFLDSEPNRLSDAFCQTLLAHTGGQALFTVETLHDLQERGDLIQDDEGYWVESPSLDWEKLPTRVEGVIEARVERLADELREVLSVAAVEGEDFTAQVIARIQQIQERKLLRTLSRELEKRHQLVREQKEVRIGALSLTRYRFAHALFQRYLYNDLSAGERRLLHGEIGAILEDLYSDRLDEVNVQLAGHYAEAGNADKAVKYLLESGAQAYQHYAYQEAIDHYERAVTLLMKQNLEEQAAQTLMKLGLAYHDYSQYRKARRSFKDAFSLLSRSSEVSSDSIIPKAPHALRFPMSSTRVLDPAKTFRAVDMTVLLNIYCALIQAGPDGYLEPYACKSWEILDSGLRYILHLRDDLTWSDCTALTAADFKYAWMRLLAPATNSMAAELLDVISGAREFHTGSITDPDSVGLKIIDKYTLEVTLKSPASYFLHMLNLGCLVAVPRHVVEVHGSAWTDLANIVTCGSFCLAEMIPGAPMTFTRNLEFPIKRLGNVQRVELLADTDLDEPESWRKLVALYEDDNLDCLDLDALPPTERDRLRHRYASDYSTGPSEMTLFIGFNVEAEALQDPRVRRALAMAIDRELISDSILQGFTIPALGGFVPPPMPGHSPTIGFPHDPERARDLLAEAGFPGGDGFPSYSILNWFDSDVPNPEEIVSSISRQWQDKLGIDVGIENVPRVGHVKKVLADSPPIWYDAWIADYPNPDSFLRVSLIREKTDWRNEQFDELIEQASRLTDQGQRLETYRKADRLLIREAVVLPIMYDQYHELTKPWIRNHYSWRWEDWIIDPH